MKKLRAAIFHPKIKLAFFWMLRSPLILTLTVLLLLTYIPEFLGVEVFVYAIFIVSATLPWVVYFLFWFKNKNNRLSPNSYSTGQLLEALIISVAFGLYPLLKMLLL